MLQDLAQRLSAFTVGQWDVLKPSWHAAPQWVYVFDQYLYRYDIDTIDGVNRSNVFSNAFRSSAEHACSASPGDHALSWGFLRFSGCISFRITHSQTAMQSEATSAEPPQSFTNTMNKLPGQ